MTTFFLSVLSIALIIAASELFSNAVEWLGDSFSLSNSTTGSLLAATGTALPETIIPIIAFLLGKSVNQIGIGAILGAPLMLATLTCFLMALTIIIMRLLKKRENLYFDIPKKPIIRDTLFFIMNYLILFVASFIFDSRLFHIIAAVILIFSYIIYVVLNLKDKSGSQGECEELLFTKINGIKESAFFASSQLIISLIILVAAGRLFVGQIEELGAGLGASLFVVAVIIAPFATELPEKYNSFRWLLKKKDTLALTNITGAMVFQSVIPVAIGLTATQWILGKATLEIILTPIISSLLILVSLLITKRLSAPLLFAFGAGYLFNLYILISSIR